jgi:hypothetical protein
MKPRYPPSTHRLKPHLGQNDGLSFIANFTMPTHSRPNARANYLPVCSDSWWGMNQEVIGGIDAEAKGAVGCTRPDAGRYSANGLFKRG